jgi:thiol-disulfide isomerase/thioredoxin
MNTSLARLCCVGWVAGVLALALPAGGVRAATKLKAGDAFPDLNQFQLEGSLPEALKGKVVLVDFWASWCGPCKASFPVMEALHQKYGKDGLVIIAVNLDDKREQMQEFLTQHTASFPIVRDAAKKLVGAVNIGSMPSSFVVDRQGKIATVHSGFHGEETRKQYFAEIEALLKAPGPKE